MFAQLGKTAVPGSQHNVLSHNTTSLVEMVAQLGKTAVPGSQHNVLVTVDYGMDGDDYVNNVIINATETQPSTFNAVSSIHADYRRRHVMFVYWATVCKTVRPMLSHRCPV